MRDIASYLIVSSFVILSVYFEIVWSKWKDLPSLSESYYRLGKKGWIFQVVLAITAFVLVPAMLELSPTQLTEFLSFLMCGGLITVGVAAKFKSDFESTVHSIAALISAISAIAYILTLSWSYSWVLGVVLCIGLIKGLLKKQKLRNNYIIILEWVAFMTLYSVVIDEYFF